jgi:steroid 5-alpha reductase family enzyme
MTEKLCWWAMFLMAVVDVAAFAAWGEPRWLLLLAANGGYALACWRDAV